MNADLEETLDELGPDYRALVTHMTAAFDASDAVDEHAQEMRVHLLAWRPFALVAASLLVLLGGIGVLISRAVREPAATVPRSAYVLAYSRDAATVEAIVRSQRADGSWDNDFITQQNAAALRASTGAASRVAYRRAVRYLRSKGLSPLSEAELHARGAFAARRTVQG